MSELILIAIAFFCVGFLVAIVSVLPILLSIRRSVKRVARNIGVPASERNDEAELDRRASAKPRRSADGYGTDLKHKRHGLTSSSARTSQFGHDQNRKQEDLVATKFGSSQAAEVPRHVSHAPKWDTEIDSSTWLQLEEVFDAGDSIEGVVCEKVNGGFLVNVCGVQSFLPDSRADTHVARKLEQQDTTPLSFQIQQLDPQLNKVVIARDHINDEELRNLREQTLESLKEGDVVEGYVKNLVEYGAFIDIGGVDGLLHLRNMSWRRIYDVSDVIRVGQRVKVKVINVDEDTMHVSFGLKQLQPDPWIGIRSRIRKHQRIRGRVTLVTHYGCFVELEPGVEGLVHVSRLRWDQQGVDPSAVTSLGEEIEVMVLDIHEEERHVDLSLRDCTDIPPEQVVQHFREGQRVFGVVQSIDEDILEVLLPGNLSGTLLKENSYDGAIEDTQEGDVVDATLECFIREDNSEKITVQLLNY
ncbi:MAG: S1 RNA-binding domain-containing protein [Gammaproteobacteria bacterium]|nr:S1 RNA-binding domain-containing protein [Gammaproteobacteria bacterium]